MLDLWGILLQDEGEIAEAQALFERTLEHIPLKSIRFERQEYAPAFESGAISCRPGESTRWTSAPRIRPA
jgi:hypothetical protein